jgi:hypothetical protein
MRKLSICSKNNLLDNPGKILISKFELTYNLRPGNCQSCQQFSCCQLILHDLQVSAKDIILSFEMSHANTKEELNVPLSHSLTSRESSLSFCQICFVLIMMICQTKGE